MAKYNVFIFVGLLLATLLGLLGQDIAYFLNNKIASIAPIYYLTVLAYTSIFLYVATAVFTFIASKRKAIGGNRANLYFTIIGFIGIMTSLWSLFVLAMWWG